MAVSFAKFPPLSPGNGDDGADILTDGLPVGLIERRVEWTDVGTTQVSYGKPKVTGYLVHLFGKHSERTEIVESTGEEVVFSTLATARAVARKILSEA